MKVVLRKPIEGVPRVKVPEKQLTHQIIRNFLMVTQIVGFFPIQNVRDPDFRKVGFKRVSWRTAFSCLSAGMTFASMVATFTTALSFHPPISQMVTPLSYFGAWISIVCSIGISIKWKKFITKVSIVEIKLFKKYGTPKHMKRLINLIIIAVFTVGFVEHLFDTVSWICWSASNHITTPRYVSQQSYIYYNYGFTFSMICWIYGWILWFQWIAPDLFIIILSKLFASRLNILTFALKKHLDKKEECNNQYTTLQDTLFYKQIREDYNELLLIIYDLDNLLSTFILCSYCSNICFVLIQLFNSIRPFNHLIETISFFYSFGFMILRLCLVTIYAASINENNKEFAKVLCRIPDSEWNVDLQRLMVQLQHDSAVLTGAGFFKISKELILKIAASIITYELVLIQFNQRSFMEYSNMKK